MPGVNSNDVESTAPSLVSLELSGTLTSPSGCEESRKVKLTMLPLSVVWVPLGLAITNPRVSLSKLLKLISLGFNP